jgi:methylmalonyl-CoA mutase C-terminal domain/subunit
MSGSEIQSATAGRGRPIRVLLAKLGLDAHTIGVTVIAKSLRDVGMEVIYSGLKQTPEMVVATAIQEDVDVVGISSLSAAHMNHLPRVIELLKEQGIDDKLIIAGGVIPKEDAATLKAQGVAEVFTMGTETAAIARYIEDWWATR